MESEKTTNVVQRVQQPFRLQLIRGQKGMYGWKIDVQAETRDELLYHVDMIDTYLRGKYLSEYSRVGTVQKPEDPHTRIEKAAARVKEATNVFGEDQHGQN